MTTKQTVRRSVLDARGWIEDESSPEIGQGTRVTFHKLMDAIALGANEGVIESANEALKVELQGNPKLYGTPIERVTKVVDSYLEE